MSKRIRKKPLTIECLVVGIEGEVIPSLAYDNSKDEYVSLPKNLISPWGYVIEAENGKRVLIDEIEEKPLRLKVGQKVEIYREPVLGITYRNFIKSKKGLLTPVRADWPW